MAIVDGMLDREKRAAAQRKYYAGLSDVRKAEINARKHVGGEYARKSAEQKALCYQRTQLWLVKNPVNRRLYYKQQSKHTHDAIPNSKVIQYLQQSMNIPKEAIPPAMIEARRSLILIRRIIRNENT